MAEVFVGPDFKRSAKILVKRYRSFTDDLTELIDSLALQPEQGTALGKNLYKVRMAIASKPGGKSGGARVITFLTYQNREANAVYLLAVFDKSDQENLSDGTLRELVKRLEESGSI